MITATFPATILCEDNAAEPRTIRGTAVPWNEIGTVSDGRRVKFLPGSLDAAARPVVTLGHTGMAIGRVSDNQATDAGMATTVRVSRVRDGDDALVLAADGVLGMFSVGAEPSDFHYDDGVMVIAAADWQHLALLPLGAFAGAVVETVAASPPQGETPMTDTLAPVVTTEAPPANVEAAAQPPAVIPVSAARPAAPPLTLSRIASLIAQANRGEISTEAVKATIQAALVPVTSTNVGAITPAAYRAELTGLVDHGTPLLNIFTQATLPPAGMAVEYPQWDSAAPNGGKPTTGIQATEKTQVVSTAVKMALKSAPIITIAGANDLSLQSVERSSPSFLEAYLRAAAVDWGRKAEAYLLSIITPLAAVVPPGSTYIENVKLLLQALNPATTPAGPLFLALSYDIAISTVDVVATEGPAFWSGNINFGSMTPDVASDGLNVVVDWNLPPKTMMAGSTQAVAVHKSAGAPTDIRVVDVSLLGLDVGVYGYIAVAPEYPGALSVMTLA
jgi:hypothetical protein